MLKKLSKIFPFLHTVSIWRFQMLRFGQWVFMRRLAVERPGVPLQFRVAMHKSLLLRKLGDSDIRLQRNKVTNLRIAAEKIDSVIIRPGETFSFWRLVGKPTARKDYVMGMLLSNGKVKEGIGGGLCQAANLLYWMALHSPLVVTERHRHSYDMFPDSGRVLPFGTGAAIYYNYVDIQFYNPTTETFQIGIRVGDTHLEGEIRSDAASKYSYKIVERDHQFFRSVSTGRVYRENTISRQTVDKRTGNLLADDVLYKNHCETLYQLPASVSVVEIS
jgi:vancomycin resistance protein VanW